MSGDPIERESDELHRRAAQQIRRDPSLVGDASAVLARWLAREPVPPHPVLLEWKAVFQVLRPAEVADFLESPLPFAKRLRGSSPFAALMGTRA